MKKWIKKPLSAVMAAAMCIAVSMPALASAADTTSTTQYDIDTDNSSVTSATSSYAFPDSALGSGDYSAYLNNFAATIDNKYTDAGNVFNIGASVDNFGVLNYQYQTLSAQMTANGWGTTTQLTVPSGQMGYSQSIQDLFTSTFGDINQQTVTKAEIPASFDVTSTMSQVISERNRLMSGLVNSSAYQTTLSAINNSNTLSMAEGLIADNTGENQWTMNKVQNIESSMHVSQSVSYSNRYATIVSNASKIASSRNDAIQNAVQDEIPAIQRMIETLNFGNENASASAEISGNNKTTASSRVYAGLNLALTAFNFATKFATP